MSNSQFADMMLVLAVRMDYLAAILRRFKVDIPTVTEGTTLNLGTAQAVLTKAMQLVESERHVAETGINRETQAYVAVAIQHWLVAADLVWSYGNRDHWEWRATQFWVEDGRCSEALEVIEHHIKSGIAWPGMN